MHDDDWEPTFADVESDTRWKWGWNSETGEATVWEISGPGDGFPSHDAYITAAWGRPPQSGKGDAVGVADRTAEGTVKINAYYGGRVPDSVVEALRSLLPAGTRIECGEPFDKRG